MASLDQNLVTTQWSILGAFGVAITLLLPKAETFRRDYLAAGKQADFLDARRWHLIVTTVPVAVLAGLVTLSLIGAHHAELTFSGGQPSQDTALVVAPVLAQLGFILMVFKVVPRTPVVREISLLPATKDPPASSFSARPSSISVSNTSDGDLQVCWINPLGTAESPNSPRSFHLSPRTVGERSTFERHTWLVSTSAGTPIGVAVAAETASHVTVDTEVVNQGLRSLVKPGEWRTVPELLPPSAESRSQSVIAIDNQSEETLTLEWVNFDGQPSNGQPVFPGTVHHELTFLGHHFLVSTADGSSLGIATASSAPHVFLVT